MLHDLRPFEERRTGKGSAKRERIEGDLREEVKIWFWGSFSGGREEKGCSKRSRGWEEEETYQRGVSAGKGDFTAHIQTHHDLKTWLNLLQVRQNIRDKYGIEKKQPTKKSDKQTAAMMEELRKEYGMDDEDAKELKDKMDKVIQSSAFCSHWQKKPTNIGQSEFHDVCLSGCCWARCSEGESGTKDGGAGHI